MKNLKFTLKAWPIIFMVTVTLCSLTGWVAKLFGVTLNEQMSVQVMLYLRKHCFDSLDIFLKTALNIALIVAVMPAIEEIVFRGLLYRLPSRLIARHRRNDNKPTTTRLAANRKIEKLLPAVISSTLFSAAHYYQMPFPDDAFFALFVFGLAQCWLYDHAERWHGIWMPALNHCLFNFTNLFFLFTLPEKWFT